MTNQEKLDKSCDNADGIWIEGDPDDISNMYEILKAKISGDETLCEKTRELIEMLIKTFHSLINIKTVKAYKEGWADCLKSMTGSNERSGNE
ncbi:MAG: hypothetical protein IKP68_08980 [Clostridia bacterium]|nr:hypothetical protein [Clostridia bacterium]